MGTKTKIAITAIVTAAVTAVLSVNATSYINRNFSGFFKQAKGIEGFTNKMNSLDYVFKNMYLYDYDEEKLTEDAADGAAKAYVEALDEPYTHYYTAEEFKSYMTDLSDEYIGIGVVVSVNDNNRVEVVSTFEDSPAYNAGILPGDEIIKVNGTDYTGEQMSELVNSIKSGAEGENVSVTISRKGEEKEISIVRRSIKTKSVDGEMLDDNIGLIHISGFNTSADGSGEYDTYVEFKTEVEALQQEGMKKLIIDLRDNPGGELSVVCNIADMLLPEGLITYMEYKNGKKEEYSSDAAALGIPMAVLINGNSASASEVLTGALKDYGVATVIGEKSYGKGIVQTVFPFADGSGVSLTVAKYYSPKGVCIHGVGIEPDIEVKLPEKYDEYYAFTVPHEEDTQLQKALETLKSE